MRITHQSIYQISKDKVFENVNSYSEMNKSIKKYGEFIPEDYNNRVGMAFEIFTQYFCMRYNNIPLLGIKDIIDTSDDPFTAGYDFTFTDFYGKPGQIQSKWRGNDLHRFTLTELGTNSSIAADYDISKDNNILFINFDDTENLFHYDYKTARNKRRVIGRNAQEEYILRDPKFWSDFRKCIDESSIDVFENPYRPREIQDWILNGHTKDNIVYPGTEKVLDGTLTKGRVTASTGAGKTLCQFYNIDSAFKKYDKSIATMILPTRSLISQSFGEFYKWKMFGYVEDGKIIDTNVSCLVIMSGANVRHNNQIANVLQTLNLDEIVNFIRVESSKGRKIVIFTTMKSHSLKYSNIIEKLKESDIKVGLEIVDEFHNIISSSKERKEQIAIANYLKNNSDRTDGSIFYSASNKDGEILSSFNEDLFGQLLANVNRNDLRERAFVCPHLEFVIIRIKSLSNSSDVKREASRVGLNLDKAQGEAVSSIVAFNYLKKYYDEPNLITFGDHVEGCRYIANSGEMNIHLPYVKNHFMAAETSNGDRSNILKSIKSSGNNILHQHSVAKEGINLPNLHGGLIGRSMSIISAQQSIGRSDRALYEDTLNFENGLITLDDSKGWKKYHNVIFLVVDSDDSFVQRLKDIVRYLLDQGIPKEEWDISTVDDEGKGGASYDSPDYETSISSTIKFDSKKFKKMIEDVELELQEEQNRIESDLEELVERERLKSMNLIDILKEKLGNRELY